MADGHGLLSSSPFESSLVNMSMNSDENEALVTLISNLCADASGYFWKGNLSQLKSFVQDVLKLTGKWSSPGGETKQFKSTEIILKWSVMVGNVT